MRIDAPVIDKTTFATTQKDLFNIVNRLTSDDNVKKLLHYPTPDALDKPALSDELSLGLLGKNIRVVPKLDLEDEVETYIIIGFDNFTPNASNPEFRDNTITFDIICGFEYWSLANYQLRPYRIMGEIDKLFNGKKLNGIGRAEFLSADQLVLSNDVGGFSLTYGVINDV